MSWFSVSLCDLRILCGSVVSLVIDCSPPRHSGLALISWTPRKTRMILFGEEVFMGDKRRQFRREFKLEAVRLVTDGKQSIAEVADRLGIRPDMLRAWKRQVEGLPRSEKKKLFPGHGKGTGQEAELKRLRREVERLEQERDFLKKAAAYFAKEKP